MRTLARADYRRKVYGCWLGKTVGGTLGQPHEGKMSVLDLTFYDPVPEGAIANDDLDLQLVWLAALRQQGPAVDERVLGDWWRRSLQYPFDEYGMAKWNLHRGLEPPVSGQFANEFGHCMGAPIRSEIWACVAPGCPALAAEYAWCDAVVDHCGEGVYGEIFLAALEAACFLESDVDRLLDIGLAYVPADCRTAGAIRLTRDLHRRGLDWLAAREEILRAYGHHNFTDAPQNLAFTVLGWLWGEGAGDAMCKAVNCGYDTDCTGATLGAILGLIHGPEIFEQRWIEPVGDEVVVGWGVVNCDCPATLQELSDWTEAVAERVLAERAAPLRLGATTADPPAPGLSPTPLHVARLERGPQTLRFAGEGLTVWVDLAGDPAVLPGEERLLQIDVEGAAPPPTVSAPADWRAEVRGQTIALTAPTGAAYDTAHGWEVLLNVGELACPVRLLPACAWLVSEPLPADPTDLDGAPTGPLTLRWTTDHRLVLDDGLDFDRVYRIRAALAVAEPKTVRLVAATPERQVVAVAGSERLRKTEPTRFIPAPHRSGAGTTIDDVALSETPTPIDLLLACRAGQPAVVHLFATRARNIDGPRLVPWADQFLRRPV